MEDNTDFLNFLDRCRKKERDAWNIFMEKYGNLIYNYIIKALRRYYYPLQDDKIDDIFHDVFLALLENDCKRLKVFRNRDEYSFIAYLRVISFNTSVDYLRKQKTFVDLENIQYRISDHNCNKKFDQRELQNIILMIRIVII